MKKLSKSNKKVICGVCGGVADFFNVDPTIIRLLVCIVSLFKGVGVVLYIIAAIVMPDSEKDISDADVENMKSANIESEKENNGSSESKSYENAPHSEEEFNNYFKK